MHLDYRVPNQANASLTRKSTALDVGLLEYIYWSESGPCAQRLGTISEFTFYHGSTRRGAIPSSPINSSSLEIDEHFEIQALASYPSDTISFTIQSHNRGQYETKLFDQVLSCTSLFRQSRCRRSGRL